MTSPCWGNSYCAQSIFTQMRKLTVKTYRLSYPRLLSRFRGAALLVSLALSSPAFAQNLLLDHATVHTVSGKTIENGQVLIRDGKIVAVGVSVPPSDAKTIDLYGQH